MNQISGLARLIIVVSSGWSSHLVRRSPPRSSVHRVFDVDQIFHEARQVDGFVEAAETVVQLAIESVELVIDRLMGGDRLVNGGSERGHRLLGGGKIGMGA